MKNIIVLGALLLLTACGNRFTCENPSILDSIGELADGTLVSIAQMYGYSNTADINGAKRVFGPFQTKVKTEKSLHCVAGLNYSLDGTSTEFIVEYKVELADDNNRFFATLVNME